MPESTPPAAAPHPAVLNQRRLPHPRAAVFAALADPAVLARWWGPAGFTNEFQEFDFRPGGVWRFVMRSAEGVAYPMEHRFLAIEAPGRIVVRHSQPGHDFTLTMTLAASGGQTELVWSLLFDDPAEAVRLRDFIYAANEQNFDRLAAELSRASGT